MEVQTPQQLLGKIEAANLVGRGGSGYSTAVKWKEMFAKQHKSIFMAVNGSEGEPGTLKDGYILEQHLEALLDGIATAYRIFPQTKTIYLYLQKKYFATYKERIEEIVRTNYSHLPVIVFEEPGGYLCGENTVLVNAIEGRRLEPRRKPPYISEVGIAGEPTIVNNLETFYQVGQIAKDAYHDTRFYSLTGDIPHPGVFDESNIITVQDLLTKTNNVPNAPYFVQLGGGASGIYLTPDELEKTSANRGTGAVIIYETANHPLQKLLQEKFAFLLAENCGKCTPCREGIFRLHEMVKTNTWDEAFARRIASALAKTSFCGLGIGAGNALLSLLSKKGKIWTK